MSDIPTTLAGPTPRRVLPARVLIAAACVAVVAAASSPATTQARPTKCPHRAGSLMKEGISNNWKNRWGSGRVITSFCYRDGRVTWRRTVTRGTPASSYGLTYPPRFADWSSGTGCSPGNRVCRTRAQFTGYPVGELVPAAVGSTVFTPVCVDTRIFGNGRHIRNVTNGRC